MKFYIGSDTGSGQEFNNKEAFLFDTNFIAEYGEMNSEEE